jgi:hypothetical protein
MFSKKKRTLFLTLIVILGCGMLGFIFQTSDDYRAATPLVFIFGAIILLVPAISSIIELFVAPRDRAIKSVQAATLHLRSEEESLWQRGIPHLVTNLYFGHIRHYPEWIHESRDYVPSSVSNAGKTEEGWVRLLLAYSDYVFPYQEWPMPNQDNPGYKDIILEIVREGVRVLTLRITQTVDKNGSPQWSPTSIEGLHVNGWVKDFQNLKAEVLAIIKDREREAREN